jgi:hypothetical protein
MDIQAVTAFRRRSLNRSPQRATRRHRRIGERCAGCCAADAVIAQVRVVGVVATDLSNDQWVKVSGTIYPFGREVIVKADSVSTIPPPETPYLTT